MTRISSAFTSNVSQRHPHLPEIHFFKPQGPINHPTILTLQWTALPNQLGVYAAGNQSENYDLQP